MRLPSHLKSGIHTRKKSGIYPKMYRVSENGHSSFLPLCLFSVVYAFGTNFASIRVGSVGCPFLQQNGAEVRQPAKTSTDKQKTKDMDREIPKEVRNKERNKKIIRYGGMGAAGIVVVSLLISLMRAGVKEKDLVFSQVSRGTIEVSVSASGKVVPAFEEIINSPISTRILEVYKKGGDSVDIGTPILKLDLQSAETDYKQKLDEEQMRSYKLKQLKLENMTKLNDLQMKVKVAAMQLNRKKVELRNEQYLDSLGSGTTDKVRQAELSYNVAELEYEQLKQQYANEKEVLNAEYQVQELDFSIFKKTLAETKRTLDDAQIRSPRKAILTYINNQIGAQVAEGSQIAVISD